MIVGFSKIKKKMSKKNQHWELVRIRKFHFKNTGCVKLKIYKKMSKRKSMVINTSIRLIYFISFFFRMKVFEAGEKEVLLVKENGKVYAMGAKCTHFGAPLNSGCLLNY